MRHGLKGSLLVLLAVFSIHSQSRVESVAVQPDGKIVAGGTANVDGKDQFAIVRYLDNGKPDQQFGTQGIVTKVIGKECKLFALTIQSDGSIVAAGYANTGRSHAVAVARFTPDGSLDSKFGKAGIVTTETGLNYARAFQILVQPDGKLLAIGHSNTKPAGGFDFLTIRYEPNGSLDRTFGSGGIVHTPVGRQNNGGQAGALQRDGKILVVGHYAVGKISRAAVVRYLPNGAPDVSFGKRGLALIPVDGTASAVTSLTDGRIIVGLDGEDLAGLAGMFIAALDSKGLPVPTFGTKGILSVGKGSLQALLPHPNGSFLVTGWDLDIAEAAPADDETTTWTCNLIIKFDLLEPRPSPAATITSEEPLCGANDIAIQSDGRILAGSWGGSELGTSFVVFRINKDGTPDPSFGRSGKAETVFEF